MPDFETAALVDRRTLLRQLAAGLALPLLPALAAPLAAASPVNPASAAGDRGGLATGNAQATVAGLEMFKAGGNAADAAAAALLMLSVADRSGHRLFCFGGEVPILVYDPRRGKVEVIAGQGVAPRLATRDHFNRPGGIPGGGIEAAATPAALDACLTLLARHGTRRFAEVSRATQKHLQMGSEPWQQDLLRTLQQLVAAEAAAGGDRLRGLSAVADTFYRGPIARQIDAWSRSSGGLLRYDDLAAHRTRIEAPVSIDFLGHTVHKCGPWTQGPYLLQALRLLEATDLSAHARQSPETIHRVTEAMKLALADRDAYYGDPLFAEVPLKALLSRDYGRMRRSLIDTRVASHQLRPGDPRQMKPLLENYQGEVSSGGPVHDTTNCVAADRAGRLVIATPSGWAGAVAGDTGIWLGSRLQSFNCQAGHPNCIAPGKRPRITLTPTLVTRGGRGVCGISVAGGDWQDQVALQLLLGHLVYGLGPLEAASGPRYGTKHLVGSFRQPPPKLGSITLDKRLAPQVAAELASRGHVIEVAQQPIGQPCMIVFDPERGRIRAAGDPATGRVAMAY